MYKRGKTIVPSGRKKKNPAKNLEKEIREENIKDELCWEA